MPVTVIRRWSGGAVDHGKRNRQCPGTRGHGLGEVDYPGDELARRRLFGPGAERVGIVGRARVVDSSSRSNRLRAYSGVARIHSGTAGSGSSGIDRASPVSHSNTGTRLATDRSALMPLRDASHVSVPSASPRPQGIAEGIPWRRPRTDFRRTGSSWHHHRSYSETIEVIEELRMRALEKGPHRPADLPGCHQFGVFQLRRRESKVSLED